jgi:hypothetical protein
VRLERRPSQWRISERERFQVPTKIGNNFSGKAIGLHIGIFTCALNSEQLSFHLAVQL